MGSWSFRAPWANLAVLLCCWASLTGAAGAPTTGGLYVTTLPAGADVWVDGTYLGRSPVLVDALSVGAHHLTLDRTGWAAADVAVTVTADQMQTTSVVLARAGKVADPNGTIALRTNDVRLAIVEVDGAPVTPAKDGTVSAPPGTHDVVVGGPQGKATRTVTVYPQTQTDIVLRSDAVERSVVIAPADDYLPASSYRLEGTRLIVRYESHEIVGTLGQHTYTVDGRTRQYDAAPTVIGSRIYLPLELLTLLTANDKN